MEKDRRIRKTKESIKKAFIELIMEKGYDNITVTDITTRSDINRGTFYLHYDDKFDLVRKIEENIFTELSHHLGKLPQNGFSDELIDERLLQYLTGSIGYISENKQLFKSLLGSTGAPQFHHNLQKFLIDSIFSNENTKKIIGKSDIPLAFYTSYISSAHLGVIQQWLEYESDYTPYELAQFMTKMFVYGSKFIYQ